MTGTFRTIALLARSGGPPVAETCASLSQTLRGRGRRVLVDASGPLTDLDGVSGVSVRELQRDSELAVAVGGDGTMLQAATLVAAAGIPLVGINRGRLGFLADISPDAMSEALGTVLDGRFVRDSRMLLRAEMTPADGETVSALALNDIVVQKYDVGHMLEVEVHMDGTYVNTHRGDGLIVSTPTGSTAYALSGGGPIMAPGLNAVAMVPICPHTLSDRPVVVPADSHIALSIVDKMGGPAQVMTDGTLMTPIGNDDRLSVTAAAERVTLLHPADYDYFRILRTKLAWGRNRSSTPG